MNLMSEQIAPENVKTPEAPGIVQDPYKAAIYKKFVDFCAMPDVDKCVMLGIPKDEKTGRYKELPTQTKFAQKFGVHINTLSQWKRRTEFGVAVDAEQKEWGIDHTPNVMAALLRRCLRYGIGTDVELYLAYYKNWDRKQVIKHVTEKFAMDDIRALLEILPKEKQDEFYGIIANIVAEAELLRGGREG